MNYISLPYYGKKSKAVGNQLFLFHHKMELKPFKGIPVKNKGQHRDKLKKRGI